ncbi:endoplasmin homolog [Galendromus occidentalis]|uniref:Heat shock protein 83 n=1 Tax=Galendromus occidentalis TaxID=34638 RepID=A0AAJ6VYR0_9ACAR|nr:endoplasmin homolog [Galendromus occidentalis]
MKRSWLLFVVVLCLSWDPRYTRADTANFDPTRVEDDIGKMAEGGRTDAEVVGREEEAIKIDSLSVSQLKEIRDKAEKQVFQAEVARMMKLIINSLYRNKEVFLRELISNASDALDKIRLLSLTNPDALKALQELSIRIMADKENNVLHITDTGIGMTKEDLVKNLGTIAKSGTAEFLQKVNDGEGSKDLNDLIGQFGVGFYSAFLVADRVAVASKNNDDDVQHVWESNASEFTVADDPRGNTLKRGTTVSLYMKDEAKDFLEHDTLKKLIEKYSQFINFNIYLWSSKTVTEEVPEEEPEPKDTTEAPSTDEDDEAKVEEEKEAPKMKKVEKTIWDWDLINSAKPIWTRKEKDVADEEYNEFYKAVTRDSQNPLARTHFTAEGELTFKSLLFVPVKQPQDSFNKYGQRTDHIKLYVRRVFITDDFQDMLPNYLSFLRGVVDSDDLPLNVSRENLQQHKLLKVIKKKLVRKALEMFRKISEEDFAKFWKEYSTNIKLGVIEDSANRSRLAKLLRFPSSIDASADKLVSLSDYVQRMKEKQSAIYYIAGGSMDEVKKSPFVERLLKRGYEVLFLTEAVDEYAISSLTEFEGKKFQNVAKEGLSIDENKEIREALEKEFEPLTKWLTETALKDKISKAIISERLVETPMALVASQFGWTGNMERIVSAQTHMKENDPQRQFYMSQKKTLEVNPRHPLIKELLRRVDDSPSDEMAKYFTEMMFDSATLRSGFQLSDNARFATNIEKMLRNMLGVSEEAQVDAEPEEAELPQVSKEDQEEDIESEEPHDEL